MQQFAAGIYVASGSGATALHCVYPPLPVHYQNYLSIISVFQCASSFLCCVENGHILQYF